MNRLCTAISLAIVSTMALSGCSNEPASKSEPVAEKRKDEKKLATITLSDKRRQALGIKTVSIRTATVQEQIELSGWVMIPQGREVALTAPVAGYVRVKNPSEAPYEGMPVDKEGELYSLKPVLSPVENIQIANLRQDVDKELLKAQISKAVAEKILERIKGLHKSKLRSDQDLEKAEEGFKLASQDLKSAQQKKKLLAQGLDTIPIKSPQKGTVLTVHASPGQYVAAAAPLITIADASRYWVRVPVPEYHVPAVLQTAQVQIALQGRNATRSKAPNQTYFHAKKIALVPKVDTIRHTADLIVELPEPLREKVVKDQMVSVYLPVGIKEKQSVVPYSAVVYDAHGGAWIYLDRTEEKDSQTHLYERRRVEVWPFQGKDVVIRPPAHEDDRVVTVGAAAHFSREFYSPPVN